MSEHEKHAEGHEEGHEGGHKSHGHHGPGGHGAHEEHGGCPEWLVSFADNVALLMGFFVILLAMNMNKPSMGGIGGEKQNGEPTASMLDLVISIREAFHNPIDPTGTNPEEEPFRRRIRERRSGETNSLGARGTHSEVQTIDRGFRASPTFVVPFAANSGEVDVGERAAIKESVSHMLGKRYMIDVRGHVSADEAVAGVDKAMRLSNERALSVAALMIRAGINPKQLRVVACADNEREVPLATDPEANRSNRRVEVIITSDPMPLDPHTQDPASPRH